MKIISIRTMRGPNIFAHRPVLILRIDLEDFAGKETKDVPGFNDALLALLPGLTDHRCALRRPGGFVERLREGTFFGHVIEHVALELSELAKIPAFFGKAISTGITGVYDLVTEFENETGMRSLLRTGYDLVQALVAGKSLPLEARIRDARAAMNQSQLGPSTQAVIDAATRRHFPWRMLSEDSSLIEIGWGRNRRRIQAAMSDQTCYIGVDIASDKQLTKKLLDDAMIAVPAGKIVTSPEDAIAAFREIGTSVAVKPLDSNQAKGVTLNVCADEEVAEAFRCAVRFSSVVLVEEMIRGNDYRVLVIDGKVVAAAQRCPAQVVGDGIHTVRELVDRTNEDPNRGEGHTKPLTLLAITETALKNLQAAGLTPESIPDAGRQVFLQQAANLSTGGTATDVTGLVHPEVARTCERAARIIGLDICGVDLVLRDICQPMDRQNGCIIEINASPGLRMHLHPSHGRRRDVGEAIMELLYPQGAMARIPLISITGTNGKTTVTRMIGHILQNAGMNVGMTTTDAMYIQGKIVARGDLTGAQSARTVLGDPTVDVAVLETARGGIVRSGLGYDWSDISVITTIQPDHIGQDDIRSVDDIFYIKSLVAERVREGGTLILNLDDERVASIAELPRVRKPERRIVYYSLQRGRDALRQRIGGNGTGYYLNNGWIMEVQGFQQRPFIQVSDIPATLNGIASFNISNAMAAIAAGRAMELDPKDIVQALMQFSADQINPGRANLFKAHKGYVLLDYGHNTEAISSIARMCAAAEPSRITGIVGLPGDRADSILEEAGRAAAQGFQRLIIREDVDLRGRTKGEVPRLLHDAVRKAAPGRECFVVPNECEALERALVDMIEDELIVVFYEKFEPLLEQLRRYGAVPAQAISAQRPVAVKTAI